MRVMPCPSSGAIKPLRGGSALRVRPMPALALGLALALAATAQADPNPQAGWQAKGSRAKASAPRSEQASAVETVRRVRLNSPGTESPDKAKTSLSWRRPTMSSDDHATDLGPRLLAPKVVQHARQVSTEAEIDAPQLNAAKMASTDDSEVEDPFDNWGQDVMEAQRVATRPFQDQALPPLEDPSGNAPPLTNDTPPNGGREPRRLTQDQVPQMQRQIAQLPPCPNPEDLRKINEITDDITPQGTEFPPECELARGLFEARSWAETTYTWKASGLCHKPLYFEDVQLERYGHTCGPLLQPFASGAHFFGNALILPYKMGMEPPCECVYALGYYRPGDCAPFMIQPLGLSWQGAFWQGATVTGLVFLIP